MWELSTQFSLTRPRGSQFDDTTTSSVPVVSVDACVMIMLQPQKTEQNELYKTPLHGTQCFQRQFGGQRGCWCEQKTTLPTPLPQQTYYAAVRVRGERWEARGRVWCCRGGACLWMMALSLIRAPAAPDAHTHMLTFMRKHTLRINLLNLRPPELQSLLSVFNKDFFPVWCQHYSLFFHAGASCLCQICPAVTVWHLPSPLHPLWCLTDCSIQPLVSVWLMMQLWTTTALELKLIRAVERHSVKQQRVLKGCER